MKARSSAGALLFLVVAIAFASPVLSRAARRDNPVAATSAGDEAMLELSTIRAARAEQLVGPYSRFRWSHPGPLYFYLLAPAYSLLGARYSSLAVGALFLSTAAGIGILACALRWGRGAAFVWTLLVTVALFADLGPELAMAWNPTVTIVPLALYVFLACGFAVGSRSALPLLALTASFLVQTHVGYLPVVMLVSVAAVGMRSVLVGGRPPSGKPLAIAVLILVAVWLPPVLEELSVEPGNLEQLARFFWQAGARRDLADAIGEVLPRLGAFWLFPVRGLVGDATRLPAAAAVIGAAELTLLTAAAAWSLRAGKHWASASCVLWLCAGLAAVWSVTRIVGDLYDWLLRWVTVVGFGGACALGSAVLPERARAVGAAWIRPRLARALLGTLVIAAIVIHARTQLAEPHVRELRDPFVRHLAASARDYLKRHGFRRPYVQIVSNEAWAVAAGVVLELRKTGYEVEVEPEWAFAFGSGLAPTDSHDAIVAFAPKKYRHRFDELSAFERLEAPGAISAYAAKRQSEEEMLLADLHLDPVNRGAALRLENLYRAAGDRDGVERMARLVRERFTPKNPVTLELGGELGLLGYDWEVVAPRRIRIVWSWTALRQTPWEYAAFVHFEGPGFRFQDDHLLGTRGHRTKDWNPGHVVTDARDVEIPAEAPPGRYQVTIGVWEPVARRHLWLDDGRKSVSVRAFEISSAG